MKRVDISVGQRLAVGSIAVAVLIAVLGGVVARSVARVSELQRQQDELIAPRAEAADDLETAIYQQAVAFRNYALSRSPGDLAMFEASRTNVLRQIARLERLPKSRAGTALFARIPGAVAAHQRSFDVFLMAAAAGGDRDTLRELEAVASRHRSRVLADVRAFASLQASARSAAAQAISGAMEDLRTTVLIVTLMIIIVSVITPYVVARAVREPAARMVAAAEAIRGGSWNEAVALQESGGPFKDELRETASTFGRMAAALKSREERLAAHARLSRALATTLEAKDVATLALREIGWYASAGTGAVYLRQDEQASLRPLATLGLHTLQEAPFAEQLAGRVAREGRTEVVRDPPADTPFRAPGAEPPRCVVATPMLLKNRVIGVLVLATITDFDADAIAFIDAAAGQLAVSIDNALAHGRIAALASELSVNNEELQVQSEELQTQNEALQCQAEELASQAEELRRAEEQKDRFLAVLGHELRNPLAAIQAAVGVMNDGHAEDRAHGEEVITRQTAHLGRLLDDLLDIGRISNGKIALAREPLDLAATAARCVATVSNGRAPVSIRTSASEPVWVDGDPTRLEQIITNLLTNALKFTPAQGSISVQVQRENDAAVLRVSDTGVGIAPELLPHIFDFLVQGDVVPEHGQRGLGLGLTLVRSLVELHGGYVSAESAGPGHGTTVTVRLPVIEAPRIAPARSAKPRLHNRKSIVVVEDNDDVRQMMELLLTRAGHTVSVAHDGPSALDCMERVRPDVALIDLDLPGFDGFEVARRVRLDRSLATIRLVALSGFGRPEDRLRAINAGFDDHLVKPVDFERLTSALDQPARVIG